MTDAGAVLYDFEQRADSNLSQTDLERISKELNHNDKKALKALRNASRGLRPDGQPLVRGGDNQVEDQLVGGIDQPRPAGGGRNQNEEGMIIPNFMRNY